MTRTLMMGPRPLTLEAEEQWLKKTLSAGSERDVVFTIYERPDLRPIGNTALQGIDRAHRIAEFGVVIGEKDAWGKGYGTETTRLMLSFAFTCLGLNNVMLRTYDYNPRAVAVYERAGFRVMGRRRQAQWFGGRAFDVIYMDCLAAEFVDHVLAPKLLPL